MRITKDCLLIVGILITGIVIGGWLMYLIDTTWVYDKVERRKQQFNTRINRYSEALDVSSQMLNNCYEAFYTVSECSTKEGCDYISTVNTLSKLNRERKNLEFKLDQLIEGRGGFKSDRPAL